MEYNADVIRGLLSLLPVLSVPVLLFLFRQSSVWPAIFTYHGLCWIVALSSGTTLEQAGLVAGNFRQWFRRTVLLSLLLLTTGEVFHYLILIGWLRPWWTPFLFLMQPWKYYVIYSLVVNPVTEEFYWRGFLLPRMSLARNAWLFWLLHAVAVSVFVDPFRAVWFTLPVLLFGLVCGWMRRRYGTLWPCILLHLAADAAIFRGAM